MQSGANRQPHLEAATAIAVREKRSSGGPGESAASYAEGQSSRPQNGPPARPLSDNLGHDIIGDVVTALVGEQSPAAGSA
jgi:hypothetical protein